MAKNKPTSAAVDRLVDRLSHLKARLKHIEGLATFKDHEGWENLKNLLDDMRGLHDRSVKAVVEQGDHLDDRDRVKQIDGNRAQRDVYAWIIQLVEAPSTEAATLTTNIRGLEKELADVRETLEDFNLAGKI